LPQYRGLLGARGLERLSSCLPFVLLDVIFGSGFQEAHFARWDEVAVVIFRTRERSTNLICEHCAGVALSARALLHAAAGPVQPIRRPHRPCCSAYRQRPCGLSQVPAAALARLADPDPIDGLAMAHAIQATMFWGEGR
jgi:hypothetical protein